MEVKVMHRPRDNSDTVPAMLDATSVLQQVLVSTSAPLTMAELAAYADPAGPHGHDVTNFGSLAANMLSGARRAVEMAPAADRKKVFGAVAAALAEAAGRWITTDVMIERLQAIAETHDRFGLSAEQLQQLIADSTLSAPIAHGTPESMAPGRRSVPHTHSGKQAGDDEVSGVSPAERPLPLMRALPPPEAFPIDMLGDVLGPAAEAIQDLVQSPWAMCGQAVLAAATLAVQGVADVELPTGQVKPISGFFLTVAATGERKSATDWYAIGPIRQHEELLRETYLAELPSYKNAKEAWDAARRAASKSHKANVAAIRAELDRVGPEPAAPLQPMLTCQEPTFEGLCRALEVGQPSVGIFATEGGQFIAGNAMNNENKLKTAAGLSSVWDGETIKRVRAADGISLLPGRRVSLHLMVQPEVAMIMLSDPELADQGLLSRCLVTAPESYSGRRFQREPAPETRSRLKAYERRLAGILQRPFPLATNSRNVLAPRALPLSADATKTWRSFADHIESNLGPGGALEPISGLANKLPEHAARLAAVLTLVEYPLAAEITDEFMSRGIVLAQHYSSEALRLFQGAKVSPDVRLAIQLRDWLLHSWKERNISLPDIYQSGPNAIRDRKTALHIAKILETHHHLLKLPNGAVVNGRRRKEAWQIVSEDPA